MKDHLAQPQPEPQEAWREFMDDPAVDLALDALQDAMNAALSRRGHVPLKTLVVIAHCDEGASIASEGCTCPGCAGRMLSALDHGFRERWPAPAPGKKARH